MLPTVKLHVKTASGYYIEARALCDTGAQGCLITTDLVVNYLNLTISPSCAPVRGIGNIPLVVSRGSISLCFKPLYNSFPEVSTSAIVIDVIAGTHPEFEFPNSVFFPNSDFSLADPTYNKPGPIDILLGADVFGALLLQDKIFNFNGLTALSTIFGYIVCGPVAADYGELEPPMTGVSLSRLIEKFWKVEETPQPMIANPLDNECEIFFKSTTSRHTDGRFIVRLPFLNDRPILGESKPTAIRRFLGLEKRLNANPKLRDKYISFMREYIELNHMSAYPFPLPNEHYFIPHHGVFKTGDTSKIRVVFDGSCPSSNGISLNECLHSGPKLQKDISLILLNFRKHVVVFVADIRMMFRMSWVHQDDRKYQLILWRESPSEPLLTYSLNTTTYGLRSSPYVAMRTLLELAEQER
ncbi:hypothetical protein V3Q77_14440, partial [Flavobacterium davisii]